MPNKSPEMHSRRGRRVSRRYKKRQRIRIIVITLLILFIGGLVSLISVLKKTESSSVFHLDHECVLGEDTCVAISGEQKVTLSADEKPESLKVITFTTTLTNIHADHIVLDLQGKKMFMGINQIDMKKVNDNTWSGSIEMSVCTTGSMTWLASLLIHDESLAYPTRAEFEFVAQ